MEKNGYNVYNIKLESDYCTSDKKKRKGKDKL